MTLRLIFGVHLSEVFNNILWGFEVFTGMFREPINRIVDDLFFVRDALRRLPAEQFGRSRVIFVPSLDDNAVWERAWAPESGVVVRVNANHRFIRKCLDRF